MAAPGHHGGNAVTQDTLITIKISVNDSLKKLKLPLRDLGANLLIDKLRHCLSIKPEQQVTFERFSDSAGGFIVLDATSPQVFKTLLRAAKAKLKLRLKATVTPDPTEKSTVETPAAQDTAGMTVQKAVEPVIVSSLAQNPARESTAVDRRSVGSGIFQFREARGSQQTLVNDEAPVPQPFNAEAGKDFFKGLADAANPAQRELAFRSREPLQCLSTVQPQWSVYCNNCDAAMLDAHYHCSICDGGDYDLCEKCIARGKLCTGEGHWLVKRTIEDGKVVASTTERISRKFQKEVEKEIPGAFAEDTKTLAEQPSIPTRTCNNCVYVLPDHEFVHCTSCEDFDLCIPCLTKDKHGHHPAHAFEAVSDETTLNIFAERKLVPGRMVRHSAICDGCDKNIFGIRHKCQDCPDWDYCKDCVKDAKTTHAKHRFAAIYTPIADASPSCERHRGIYCDGPLCIDKPGQSFITGVRYKCAVCHDTDFCAACEALPNNKHNRTHPLIKFKTAVKNVSITTMNEDVRGRVRNMGDQFLQAAAPPAPVQPVNAASQVQTVAEIKPTKVKEEKAQPIPVIKSETKESKLVFNQAPSSLLTAAFVHDSVPDGHVVEPGSRFTQIWTLKNEGPFNWPAGCSVRYVGGDNMLNVDNTHPASVTDIADATESNVVGREVQVGEEIAFKVTLRAPVREGRAISYWRVKAADGTPFGHRLWCDVEVKKSEPVMPTPIEQPVPWSAHLTHRAQMVAKQQAQQGAIRQAMQQQMAQRQEMLRQLPIPNQAQPQNPMSERVARKMAAFSQSRAANANFTAALQDTYSAAPAGPSRYFPTAPESTEADRQRKEAARARVEVIKAKILKARAEKWQRKAVAQEDEKVKKIIEEASKAPVSEPQLEEELASSQMVFPTLEKESPAGSFIASSSSSSKGKGKAAYVENEAGEVEHAAGLPDGREIFVQTMAALTAPSHADTPVVAAPSSVGDVEVAGENDEFDDLTDDLEVLSAESALDSEDNGFLTDEEYDILDASDSETVASK